MRGREAGAGGFGVRRAFARVAVLVLIATAGAEPLTAQIGNLGRRPTPDPSWHPIEMPYSLIVDGPRVEIGPGRLALLTFQTAVPTPPAACACGIVLPGAALRLPHYCRVFRETGGPDSLTRHEIPIDLARLESRCGDFDPALRQRKGGVIDLELELYHPQLQQGIALPFRFAYRDSLRVPCLSDGPWFDIVDGTRAVLSWGTDLPVSGVVRYAMGDPSRAVRSDAGTREIPFPEATRHRVELTDLAPGAPCRYWIRLDDPRFAPDSLVEGPYAFTPPVAGVPFTFAVLGDSRGGIGPGEMRTNGVNLRTLRLFCRDAWQRGAGFILFSGDMADGQTTFPADLRRQWETWKRGADMIGPLLPVYEAMGNHEACYQIFGDSIPRAIFDREGPESVEAIFTETFANPGAGAGGGLAGGLLREVPDAPDYGSTAYWFRWGRSLFVVLNTDYWVSSDPEILGGNLSGFVMDRQLVWVEGLLRDATGDATVDHVFVMFHTPPFPCGGHADGAMWYFGGSPERNRGPHDEPIDRGYVVERRDRLWRAFAQCGKVRAVFACHEHNYSRLLITATTPVHRDGSGEPGFTHPVWQCVSGGCGAPSYARGQDVPWAGAIAAFSMKSHYLLVGVSGGDVALFAIGETGEEIDGCLLVEDGRVAGRPLSLAQWREWVPKDRAR